MNSYMNENSSMNQIMMMAVFPMISTLSATLFQSLITDFKTFIGGALSWFFKFCGRMLNKYVFNIYDDYNELHIMLSDTQSMYNSINESVLPEGLPLVWYLNTNSMLKNNSLKTAKLYDQNEKNFHTNNLEYTIGWTGRDQQGPKETPTLKPLLYVPIIKDLTDQSNTNQQTQQTQDSGKSPFNQSTPIQNKTSSSNTNKNSLIEIDKDIFLELREKTISGGSSSSKTTIFMVLKSNKKTIAEIGDFYKSVKEQYDKFNMKKLGKLYVFNGSTKNSSTGVSTPNFSCFDLDTSQSFDNIFLKNKTQIIEDIQNLTDKEYYKTHGIKRKIGHLYVGPPGSGKTCLVTAIAKMTGRSVVYIPISRIKNNLELQNIIYDRSYNGVTYAMDELIFLMDELDSLETTQKLKKTSGDNSNVQKKDDKDMTPTIIVNTAKKSGAINLSDDNFDKLNIGLVLNILDGNNDQDGMILIGTANSHEKLDPALYRNGRMELINFEYMDRSDIAEMIEHYYQTTLSEEQNLSIRNDKTVQSLNLRNICLKYIRRKKQHEVTVSTLINELNSLFDNAEENNVVYEKMPMIKLDTPMVPANMFGIGDLDNMNMGSYASFSSSIVKPSKVTKQTKVETAETTDSETACADAVTPILEPTLINNSDNTDIGASELEPLIFDNSFSETHSETSLSETD